MDKVSVVVVTYNSESTIRKTLDSIFAQTYQNLELIVQDDCSTDKTVSVIEKWTSENDVKRRFIGFVLFSNKVNLGTSNNVDSGCNKATGKWIKIVAGDDILIEDCIEKNIEFTEKFNDDVMIMSDVIDFYEDSNGRIVETADIINPYSKYLRDFNIYDSKEQYARVLRRYVFAAPTFFFPRSSLIEVGGFDTRYNNLDDWPLVIRWTKNGKCIRYMEEKTVYYRVGAPETMKGTTFYNSELEKLIMRLKYDEIYPHISKLDIVYWLNELVMCIDKLIMINIFKNRKNNLSTVINYIITWFAPYNWTTKLYILRQIGITGLLKRQKYNLRKAD